MNPLDEITSYAIAALLVFLMVGGGFFASLVFLGVASRIDNLKTRAGLVAISFFVVATQVTCFDRMSHFAGENDNAIKYSIFKWSLIIICAWSIYLIRNTSVMIIIRRGVIRVYGSFVDCIMTAYKNAVKLIYTLNAENHKRYNRMSSHKESGENEPPDND